MDANNQQNNILARLMARRDKLREAYDQLLLQPASYSISGSVSVTQRNASELSAEIARIDRQIARILGGRTPYGMTLQWPDYRRGGTP